MEQPKSGKMWGIIGGIIVVIAGILGYTNFGKTATVTTADQTGSTTDTSTDTSGTSTEVAVTTPAPTQTTTSKYKDGTYSADGTYVSPGGGDQVGVTLTIKDDIVTAATFTPKPGDPESAQYQARFASGYKQYVVGKNLDQINVGRVSGSSLTARGFNDAVAKIKVEAQA